MFSRTLTWAALAALVVVAPFLTPPIYSSGTAASYSARPAHSCAGSEHVSVMHRHHE